MSGHFSDRIKRLEAIIKEVVATAEVLGQEITPKAAKMIAEDIERYSNEDIASGLTACRREITGKLTLAAIVQRIERNDGHPEPNEAWSIAIEGLDENKTVVTTNEILRAMAVAQPVMNIGDKIGARMAFLDAYKREVEASRRSGSSAKWSVSSGWCSESRKVAIEQAVDIGRLPKQQEEKLMLEHTSGKSEFKHEGKTLDDHQEENFKKLKEQVSYYVSKQRKIEQGEKERAEFERHKEREIKRLKEWASEQC